MSKPKDYLEEEPLQKVQDIIAENRIKWSTIVQSLILASILGTVAIGYAFGNHMIKESQDFKKGIIGGIDSINNTLKEIRGDIGELNTGIRVNEVKITNHEYRITKLEESDNE